MEISYSKNNNGDLFEEFKKEENLNMKEVQNYIPIYDLYFSLNENNFNSINLNQYNRLEGLSLNNKGTVKNELNDLVEKDVFFKFSPLLDPVKYLTGKYNTEDKNLFNLPKYGIGECHKKILDKNNSAYVDAFATYLISQLLHRHKFINGLDYYGSYLGIKKNFELDIIDDIEYLYENDYFKNNMDKIFTIDNRIHEEFINTGSRNNKKHLNISQNTISPKYLNLTDIKDLDEIETLFKECDKDKVGTDVELMFTSNREHSSNMNKSIARSSSTCSSRTSLTNSDTDSGSYTSEDEESGSSCSTATEDKIMACIKEFPVEVISLEKCENTFDYLLAHNKITNLELESAITQILLTLITYQKVFQLTHNDLHTNNIMYIKTDIKFLYYKYKNVCYKVPTYGKIFKIIDFGRAIYKYNDVFLCSDSFHPKGDAATQYNIEPYFNENKPRLGPNMSFDLCRLGCSMYDFIVEDINDDIKKYSKIEQIILNWCYDDKGRNILYKNNGSERYPEFKLYKMITRLVHNHTPEKVFDDPFFSKFFVKNKIGKKQASLMDIDNYPVCV